jgi:two-component system, chemotaxis family, sensor kinase CheA
MNMEQALQTYIAESRGLLHEMEDALLGLEHDPANAELIGALFRAAHTIKGSAGLFGLDPVVAFTHVVENLLDQLRDGDIKVCEDLIGVLLACCDHIGALIDRVAEAGEALDANQIADGERLLVSLHGYLGQGGAQLPAERAAPQFERAGAGVVAADSWLITVQFGPEVLRNGMDPASFLRYLASIGQIVSLRLCADAMPALEQMDPEACYLGFEVQVCGVAGKQAIEDVFEFVREDCKLRIEAPPSHWSQQAAQIEKSAGAGELLGEILTEAGVLTPGELDHALAVQDDGSAPAAAHPPLGQVLVGEGLVPGVVVDVALEKQKQIREQKMQAARFIRVSADKLDQLINRVGELVIAGASASLLAQCAKNAPLQEATAVISRFVEEIREDALRLRMVEIGETFNRFQRVVRDVSRDLGKDIELRIGGAETELDKTVIEKIGDPLTHLVRNAIDHGIENAAQRAACGKPARGRVRLNAYHDSGSIVIEVGDDGGGLSRAKILAKAVERGIVAPDAVLSDGEVFKLIFAPGFSTAAAVTNLSGRGVGLDVVKRNIEALRGTVDIDSVEGQGSTVRIRLPLTLAIIDGFLVGVGRSSYVLPLDVVHECVEISDADRAASGEAHYLNLRGEVLPYLRLREQFNVPGARGRRENVVVVQYGGSKAGLVVDELMGEFQTVIKPLGKMFSGVRGISGSTILGSGSVALILDVPALIGLASQREAALLSA